MLLFGFALSWVGVAAGAAVRTPEALQGIMFAVVFPLTFVSSAFVPVAIRCRNGSSRSPRTSR